jgi:hypothetical protein
MMVVIVRYHGPIIIVILIVERSSASLGPRRNRRWRGAAPSCDDIRRQQVISTKMVKE